MNRMAVIVLLLSVWIGSGITSYTVVELTGGGPAGPQGEQGEPGPRGAAGARAEPALGSFQTPCSEAADSYQEGLARPGLSFTQLQGLYDHAANVCGWD